MVNVSSAFEIFRGHFGRWRQNIFSVNTTLLAVELLADMRGEEISSMAKMYYGIGASNSAVRSRTAGRLKKGAACLVSAALVLTSVYLPGGGY